MFCRLYNVSSLFYLALQAYIARPVIFWVLDMIFMKPEGIIGICDTRTAAFPTHMPAKRI